MKINIIKIFFLINILYMVYGAIEDPVARHDLSECSTYLCPTYRVMAEDYMRDGCVGEFKEYVLKGMMKGEYESKRLNMISKKREDKYVNIDSLYILVMLSSLISVYIGFYVGKKENEIIFLMKEFD